jgi:hemerythrin
VKEMILTRIPGSITEEHEEIFRELRRFASQNDRVGEAIKELLRALEPHFEKEDEVAMPLLGALAPLSSDGGICGNVDEVVLLQSKLTKELPSMLSEHRTILALIKSGKRAAEKEKRQDVFDSLSALEHHARVEEEVLYPAALLAGIVARASQKDVRA